MRAPATGPSASAILRIGAAGLLVVALAACGTGMGSGGGWLPGKAGGRATIGFDGVCVDGAATGSLTYHDRSVTPPVNLALASGTCSGTATDSTITGTYRARPRGASGQVTLTFHDSGARGPNKGDTVSVVITGGAFDGYSHSGTLQGGNVTFTLLPPTPSPTPV